MMEESHEEKAKFIPFHAINEFMRDDFRLDIIRATLSAKEKLPSNFQKAIDANTRKLVNVPGFRNSIKAPAVLRAKATVDAFEKSPKMVAAILSAWAELNPDLRLDVYDMLVDRGWITLPLEADRTKLPGFMIRWPEGEGFDSLNEDFRKRYPQMDANDDQISLMVVWVSLRLPYQLEENLFDQHESPEEAIEEQEV